MNIVFEDWGLVPYKQAWERQQQLFDTKVENVGKNDIAATVVFCEHPPVYTLGKHGKDSNMLLTEDELRKINADCLRIDRGGDITFHGPGQQVCYPICDLNLLNIGLKSYINLLEQVVIDTLAFYGIKGERLEHATGVWLDAHTPDARKICAIGVRVAHFVTMHGFALNVNTDLRYFSYINPCGFTDKGVTSIQKETGKTIDLQEVRRNIADTFRLLLPPCNPMPQR